MIQPDEQLFLRKIKDKAGAAFFNDYPTFTDFLDLNEQRLLASLRKELPDVRTVLWGGYNDSERKIAGFFPIDYAVENNFFPIDIIKIESMGSHAKPLSHRDYLGAVVNLGLSRQKLGDILCHGDFAYLFCEKQMAPFILENLILVRQTHITCLLAASQDIEYIAPQYDLLKGTVSSLRLDSVVKLAFSLSRSHAVEYIEGGRVTINSRQVEKPPAKVEKGDVISVRGLGKFKIGEVGDITRKGRIFIEINKYK